MFTYPPPLFLLFGTHAMICGRALSEIKAVNNLPIVCRGARRHPGGRWRGGGVGGGGWGDHWGLVPSKIRSNATRAGKGDPNNGDPSPSLPLKNKQTKNDNNNKKPPPKTKTKQTTTTTRQKQTQNNNNSIIFIIFYPMAITKQNKQQQQDKNKHKTIITVFFIFFIFFYPTAITFLNKGRHCWQNPGLRRTKPAAPSACPLITTTTYSGRRNNKPVDQRNDPIQIRRSVCRRTDTVIQPPLTHPSRSSTLFCGWRKATEDRFLPHSTPPVQFKLDAALRPQRPEGLLGTGSPGRPPRPEAHDLVHIDYLWWIIRPQRL